MDPTSSAVLDAVGDADRGPAAHRPGARRRQRPVAVRGLDPRPRADPRGPQRRRPGRPGALGRRRHRRDDVRQPRRRATPTSRPGPAGRPPSRSTTSSAPRAPWPSSCPGSAPSRPSCAWSAPPGSSSSRPKNIPFMRLRELVYHHVDLLAGFGFADVDPEVQRVLLDEEVRRLRAGDPPARPHPAHPGRRRVDGRCGHGIRRRATVAPCWAGSGAASPTALTGDPLPQLPEGR